VAGCPLIEFLTMVCDYKEIQLQILDEHERMFGCSIFTIFPSRSPTDDNSFHMKIETRLDNSSPSGDDTSIQETDNIERNESEMIIPLQGNGIFQDMIKMGDWIK